VRERENAWEREEEREEKRELKRECERGREQEREWPVGVDSGCNVARLHELLHVT